MTDGPCLPPVGRPTYSFLVRDRWEYSISRPGCGRSSVPERSAAFSRLPRFIVLIFRGSLCVGAPFGPRQVLARWLPDKSVFPTSPASLISLIFEVWAGGGPICSRPLTATCD